MYLAFVLCAMKKGLYQNDSLSQKKEARKRWLFILKLLLLVLVVFLREHQQEMLAEWSVPANLFKALTFYISGNLLISFSRLVIVYLYGKRKHIKKGFQNNFMLGINRIADILNTITFIIATMLLVGINPWQLITSLSIVAAAIALLSKDYISNMINGMIIMFSDELSLGDYVSIREHRGRIVDITLVNLHLINDDEDLIYIPNNSVFASDVINFTKRSIRKISFEFDIKNEKITQVEKLEAYLKNSLEPYAEHIKPGSYNLKIQRLGDISSSLKFQFVMLKSNKELEKEIRKVTLRHVLRYGEA